MKIICAEAAAGSFVVLASGFPVPEDVPEDAPAVAASVRGSKVVKGSWRALDSGFPRRSLGRSGSSSGSSDADAGAFAVSAAAGALAVSGAGGGFGSLAVGAAVVGAGAV